MNESGFTMTGQKVPELRRILFTVCLCGNLITVLSYASRVALNSTVNVNVYFVVVFVLNSTEV